MKLLHQGEIVPPEFNHFLVKLILLPEKVYYFENDMLCVYNRKDIRITFNKEDQKIRSFDRLNAKPLDVIDGQTQILEYLENNVNPEEYCEFEKFLFERNG